VPGEVDGEQTGKTRQRRPRLDDEPPGERGSALRQGIERGEQEEPDDADSLEVCRDRWPTHRPEKQGGRENPGDQQPDPNRGPPPRWSSQRGSDGKRRRRNRSGQTAGRRALSSDGSGKTTSSRTVSNCWTSCTPS